MKKKSSKKVGSLLLSVVMVFSMLPSTVYAEDIPVAADESSESSGSSEPQIIASFDERPAEMAAQSYAAAAAPVIAEFYPLESPNIVAKWGTSQPNLGLPTTLKVRVEEANKPLYDDTVQVAKWVSSPIPYYPYTAGKYTFTPVLKEVQYPVKDGCPLPTIEVLLTEITGFIPPEGIEANLGTPRESLGLPTTLAATYTGSPNDEATVAIPVSWVCETYNKDAVGTYTFTPVLGEHPYSLGDEVVLPTITVTLAVITSFAQPSDISVAWGTPRENLDLPDTLMAFVDGKSDEATVAIPVSWVCETYNKDVAGTYAFTPVLGEHPYSLGDGVVVPTITVVLMDEGTIVGFIQPTNITQARGTPQEALDLPATLAATLDGHSEEGAVPVSWACEGYSKYVEGTYVFVPTLGKHPYLLKEGVELPRVTVTLAAGEIFGEGYSFNQVDGKLIATTAEGTSNWREDTRIADERFDRFYAVKSAELVAGVTGVGEQAFLDCINLESVVIPDGVKVIGRGAFESCKNLESVTFPASLEAIEGVAFEYCASLKEVTFPANLKTIGNGAFADCSGLTILTFLESAPPSLASYAFDALSSTGTIFHLGSAKGFTEDWKKYTIGLPGWTLQDDSFVVRFDTNGAGGASLTDNEMKTAVEAALAGKDKTKINTIKLSGTATEVTGYNWKYLMELFAEGSEWSSLTTLDLSEMSGLAVLSNVKSDDSVVSKLATVRFPEGLQTIGDYAFYGCSGLAEVNLPKSLQAIGSYAFHSCAGLKSINLPKSLQTISDYVFSHCTSLTEVTFPASLKTIGNNAFDGCSSLTSLTFMGDTPPSIGSGAFSAVSARGTIVYPSGASGYTTDWKDTTLKLSSWTLQDDTFEVVFDTNGTGGTSLTDNEMKTAVEAALNLFGNDKEKVSIVKLSGTATEITDYNWKYLMELFAQGSEWSGLTTLDLSEMSGLLLLKKEEDYSAAPKLTAVHFPENLQTIGDYAFYGCSGLAEVNLPKSLRAIGEETFNSCMGLKSVSLPEGLQTIGDYAFYDCTGLAEVSFPASLKDTGSHAFQSCAKLKTLNFSEGLQSIGNASFAGCSDLTEVNLPEGLKTINIWAFDSCTGLKSVNFPESLQSIGKSAFHECDALVEVSFPAGLQTIGDIAFQSCNSLTSLIFLGSTPPPNVSTNSFLEDPAVGTIFHLGSAKGFTEDWKNKTLKLPGWTFIDDSFVVRFDTNGTGGTSLTDNEMKTAVEAALAGKDKTKINTIKLTGAATEVTGYNWKYLMELFAQGSEWSSLTTFNLSEMSGLVLLKNEKGGYFAAPKLTAVHFPEGLQTIGDYAFYDCDGLTEVSLPKRLETIGNAAFESCAGLKDVSFPIGLQSIGNAAFSSCTGLESVTLQAGLETIGDAAFSSCTGLKSVTFPKSLQSIGNAAFNSCTSLESVSFPVVLQTIGDSAFYGCTGLKSAHFPIGLQSIGNSAFNSCAGLESVSLQEGLQTLGDSAFHGCTGLTKASFPKSLQAIGDQAFGSCGNLTGLTFLEDTPPRIGSGAFSAVSTTGTIAYPSGASGYTDVWKDTTLYLPSWTFEKKEVFEVVFNGDGDSMQQAVEAAVNGKATTTFDVVKLSGTATEIRGDNWNYLLHMFEEGSEWSGLTTLDLSEMKSLVFLGDLFPTHPNISQLTTVQFPEGLQSIGQNTFFYCTGLKSVSFPEGLQSIGNSAFYYCAGLESVSFPKSLQTIDIWAFACCDGLTAFSVAEGNPNFATRDGVLYSKDETTLVAYPAGKSSAFTMPEGVQTIGSYAFYTCDALTNVRLPEGLEVIGYGAFYQCHGLTDVNFPESLKIIDDGAFNECLNLTDESFPAGLQTIGISAFFGCGSLTELVFPAGLQTMGESAFDNCVSLTSLTFMGDTPPSIGSGAFSAVSTMGTIVYPVGAVGYTEDWMHNNPQLRWNLVSAYRLTVENGTDETKVGLYGENATVQIKATLGSQEFDHWTTNNGGSFKDASSATTTFTMPAAHVAVTANYKGGHRHSFGTDWKSDGTKHWHECTAGDGATSDEAAHSGGTANCHAPAVCEICKVAYGELAPDNHDGQTEVRDAIAATEDKEGYSGDVYCLGCGVKLENGHSVPKLDHTHQMTKVEAKAATHTEDGNIEYYTCSICGKLYKDADGAYEITLADTVIRATGHTYGSDWKNDDTKHWHECTAGDGATSDEAAHSGGTANCHAPAVCEICKVAYGELAPDNHDGQTEVRDAIAATEDKEGYSGDVYCLGCGVKLKDGHSVPKLDHTHQMTKVEAKAATPTEDGNIEYYTCSICGKLYKDADGAYEITLADTVIRATGTSSQPGDKPNPSDSPLPMPTNKPGSSGSPATGDNNNMFLWACLLSVSGGALVVLRDMKKKRNTRKK